MRPVVERRLKDREIADVLIGKLDLQVPQILRDLLGIHVLHHAL